MRILLAVDGSRFSEAAIQFVSSSFRAQDCQMLALEVVEPAVFSTPPQMAAGYAPEMAERLEISLGESKDSVSHAVKALQTAGFKAEGRVIEADIRTGILDTALEWCADLIVLGSHGEKGFRDFFVGSVSESIAKHAACSVLIVRAPSAA
jgi:nucleotide-binding universal stress UspA family protein